MYMWDIHTHLADAALLLDGELLEAVRLAGALVELIGRPVGASHGPSAGAPGPRAGGPRAQHAERRRARSAPRGGPSAARLAAARPAVVVGAFLAH
eukprot:scaffold153026_cov29-Prasinocladus_malaysianus.AAC.1